MPSSNSYKLQNNFENLLQNILIHTNMKACHGVLVSLCLRVLNIYNKKICSYCKCNLSLGSSWCKEKVPIYSSKICYENKVTITIWSVCRFCERNYKKKLLPCFLKHRLNTFCRIERIMWSVFCREQEE